MAPFTRATLAAGLAALVGAAAGPARADISQPLEPGEKVAYILTGWANNPFVPSSQVTVFSCTNVSSKGEIRVRVRLFLAQGIEKAVDTQTLGIGETRTWVTSPASTLPASVVDLGIGNPVKAPALGSGRITVLDRAPPEIVCDMGYLDPSGANAEAYGRVPMQRIKKPPKVRVQR